MAIAEFDDIHAPWGEWVSFGNPWHGTEQGGALKRRDGVALAMPVDVAYARPADGGNKLIDLGMPALTTSDQEKALGMSWWNKAILAGSGLNAALDGHVYNPVRGSAAEALLFRRACWPVRCTDGTTWLLWLSPENKIRGQVLEHPAPTLPENTTGGSVLLDLSAVVVNSVTVGLSSFDTHKWINFAPNGRAAALHVAFINGAGRRLTHQIIELSVTGGDVTTAPTLATTLSRTGAQLTVTTTSNSIVEIREKAMTMTDGGSTVIVESSDPAVRRVRNWGTFVNAGSDSTDPGARYVYNGTSAGSDAVTWLVVYDAANTRVELGSLSSTTETWVGSISQPGYSYDYVTNGYGTIISGTSTALKLTSDYTYQQHRSLAMTRNGAQVGAKLYAYDQTGVFEHFEQWFGTSNVTSSNTTGSISNSSIAGSGVGSGVEVPLYGNLLLVSDPILAFASNGNPTAGTRAVYGYAAAGGGACAASPMATLADINDFAIDPETGSFTSGVTRYF